MGQFDKKNYKILKGEIISQNNLDKAVTTRFNKLLKECQTIKAITDTDEHKIMNLVAKIEMLMKDLAKDGQMAVTIMAEFEHAETQGRSAMFQAMKTYEPQLMQLEKRMVMDDKEILNYLNILDELIVKAEGEVKKHEEMLAYLKQLTDQFKAKEVQESTLLIRSFQADWHGPAGPATAKRRKIVSRNATYRRRARR